MNSNIRINLMALAWAGLNVLLSGAFASSNASWTARAMLCLMPCAFIWFAPWIAALLPYGFGMERFASDRDTPQSPAALVFLGFVLLFLSSILFVIL